MQTIAPYRKLGQAINLPHRARGKSRCGGCDATAEDLAEIATELSMIDVLGERLPEVVLKTGL